MKLELKHLTPYLPYELNGYATDIKLYGRITLETARFIISEQPRSLPILRPLSESLKEDGFLDIHSEFSKEKFIIALLTDIGRCGNWKQFITLEQADWLFEHHFDVFGLIDAGLAIDINTLQI